jgi:hypothetical protein
MKKKKNLSKDLFGQIGSLKERNSFSSADPAIAVQIGSSKVRFEQIHLILPRHFLLFHYDLLQRFSIQIPQQSKSNIKKSETMPKSNV